MSKKLDLLSSFKPNRLIVPADQIFYFIARKQARELFKLKVYRKLLKHLKRTRDFQWAQYDAARRSRVVYGSAL